MIEYAWRETIDWTTEEVPEGTGMPEVSEGPGMSLVLEGKWMPEAPEGAGTPKVSEISRETEVSLGTGLPEKISKIRRNWSVIFGMNARNIWSGSNKWSVKRRRNNRNVEWATIDSRVCRGMNENNFGTSEGEGKQRKERFKWQRYQEWILAQSYWGKFNHVRQFRL